LNRPSIHALLFSACTLLAAAGAWAATDPSAQPDTAPPRTQGGNGSDFDLPQIGEAGASAISPEEEYELGVQVMNELRDAGAILDDPQLAEYLQNLGHELSSRSDNPSLHFSFSVINDDTINAVTLPGGFIVVNSGLILMTDNEDELAGVMAHEIGHVTQRHLARQLEDQQDRSLLNFATMLGAILAAARTSDPNMAVGALATAQASIIQHQINYTRSDEAEADRVGIATLARAGFPPRGMVDFFAKMQQNSSLNGYDKIPEFLLDHPLDLTRMADMQSRAEQIQVAPKADSRSYALMRARLRVLEAEDANTALEFFKNNVDGARGWEQTAMRYGLALADARTGRYTDATALMQALATQYDDVIAFRIGLADAQMQAGNTQAAIASYAAAMKLFPDSTPLMLSYGDDLIDVGKPQDAIELLKPIALGKEEDPEAVRLLAKAYDKAGNHGDSHFYMSEYYLMSGLPAAAVEQLRIALGTPGINSVQKQRYRARLDRLTEEAKAARASKHASRHIR
jgi:predicted Zn-dependent protease